MELREYHCHFWLFYKSHCILHGNHESESFGVEYKEYIKNVRRGYDANLKLTVVLQAENNCVMEENT